MSPAPPGPAQLHAAIPSRTARRAPPLAGPPQGHG
eukprot:CAMPEP_0174902820 /NCGR_PEP_ID=MMETSP0167-20121228/40018_1 /TAXON_ID=38298 /ORGANISM="Rhodella maculata, Strain CCMP736" /LENGTH=34 /DNA_ID= /DNA_START= /DNA_END= /DNA_ORIENTATION=